jgi:hypothetical protein
MVKKEIYQYIIAPTLKQIELFDNNADILVYGTGEVESRYDHIVQIGAPKGGALSPWQIEPRTYLDHILWLENGFANGLKAKILEACYLINLPRDPTVLIWNWRLAVCICRIHYYRVREKIPSDAEGLSYYHKKYYNSYLGKADPVANTAIFQKIWEEVKDGKG